MNEQVQQSYKQCVMKSIIFMCKPVETQTRTSAQTLAWPLFSFSVLGFYYPAFATLQFVIVFITTTFESLMCFA